MPEMEPAMFFDLSGVIYDFATTYMAARHSQKNFPFYTYVSAYNRLSMDVYTDKGNYVLTVTLSDAGAYTYQIFRQVESFQLPKSKK